ncbi:MAG: ABC transporter substrate-binding protein [Nostocales cyanobacterium 94392]|nr:ABC transporter substrate-binding protein [Nostocales cyanobacterium 94392]
MNTKITSLAIILLLSISLISCSSKINTDEKAENKTEQNINQPTQVAKRIVALTPLAADLIYNLNKTTLVGISNGRYTSKETKFSEFPRVGERGNINLEKIIALKPDLVIGSELFQSEALTRLKELGIDTISHQTNSWQELENLTITLANRIDTNPKPILNKYQSFLNNIPDNGKSVLVLVSRVPVLSPNKNSWAGDLLTKFKYKNMTADFQSNGRFQGYLTLSQEKILTANPDKIFLIESDDINPDELKKETFWSQLKATQNNQVYIFHHDGLISPTSIDTVEEVTNQLRQAAKE